MCKIEGARNIMPIKYVLFFWEVRRSNLQSRHQIPQRQILPLLPGAPTIYSVRQDPVIHEAFTVVRTPLSRSALA